jgi:hypothetical protein
MWQPRGESYACLHSLGSAGGLRARRPHLHDRQVIAHSRGDQRGRREGASNNRVGFRRAYFGGHAGRRLPHDTIGRIE